jgi:hypothetical protein
VGEDPGAMLVIVGEEWDTGKADTLRYGLEGGKFLLGFLFLG